MPEVVSQVESLEKAVNGKPGRLKTWAVSPGLFERELSPETSKLVDQVRFLPSLPPFHPSFFSPLYLFLSFLLGSAPFSLSFRMMLLQFTRACMHGCLPYLRADMHAQRHTLGHAHAGRCMHVVNVLVLAQLQLSPSDFEPSAGVKVIT